MHAGALRQTFFLNLASGHDKKTLFYGRANFQIVSVGRFLNKIIKKSLKFRNFSAGFPHIFGSQFFYQKTADFTISCRFKKKGNQKIWVGRARKTGFFLVFLWTNKQIIFWPKYNEWQLLYLQHSAADSKIPNSKFTTK